MIKATLPQSPILSQTDDSIQPSEVAPGFERMGSIMSQMFENLVRYGDMLHGEGQSQRRTHKPNTRKGR